MTIHGGGNANPMRSPITFRLAEGFNFERRSIGFLEGSDDLDAGLTFDRLPPNTQKKVRSRMDHWLTGGIHDPYFHGWPNDPRYKGCFVFKWEERKVGQRLYGFLCNPKPESEPSFQSCVLVAYDKKAAQDTDPKNLERAKRWSNDLRATEAISNTYAEYKRKEKWKQ